MELILAGVALGVIGYFVYSRVQIGREERKAKAVPRSKDEKPSSER